MMHLCSHLSTDVAHLQDERGSGGEQSTSATSDLDGGAAELSWG